MIRVGKVTVNIGVGSSGEELEKAEKLLLDMCEQKPVRTLSKSRIPTWNVRKKQPIGVKVTLRGEKAVNFVKNVIRAKDNKLPEKSFDVNGNFSFGVHEYIDIPGVKYDPDIGIFGFDVCVTLEREGYSIKRRKRCKAHMPEEHKVGREEAMKWVQTSLGVEVIKESDEIR